MPLTLDLVFVGKLLGGLVEHGLAPAADVDGGAELRVGLAHHLAEAGPAAGHEDALTLQDAVLQHQVVHDLFLPVSLRHSRSEPGLKAKTTVRKQQE